MRKAALTDGRLRPSQTNQVTLTLAQSHEHQKLL